MRGALESSLLVALCLFLGGCITADSSTAEHSLEAAQPSLGHMIEQPQFFSEPGFELPVYQQESHELLETAEQTLVKPRPIFECGLVGFDSLAWKFHSGMRLSLKSATLSWVPIEGQVNTEMLHLVLHPPFDPSR